jgi:hypothetical protein
MTNYPYILFNQSPAQLRQIGARGGRAQARNRRAHLSTNRSPQTPAPLEVHRQTAAQAIAALDAQFPWLRGAEKRNRNSNGRPPGPTHSAPPGSCIGSVVVPPALDRNFRSAASVHQMPGSSYSAPEQSSASKLERAALWLTRCVSDLDQVSAEPKQEFWSTVPSSDDSGPA